MITGFSLARKQPNKIEMKHLLITTIVAVRNALNLDYFEASRFFLEGRPSRRPPPRLRGSSKEAADTLDGRRRGRDVHRVEESITALLGKADGITFGSCALWITVNLVAEHNPNGPSASSTRLSSVGSSTRRSRLCLKVGSRRTSSTA